MGFFKNRQTDRLGQKTEPAPPPPANYTKRPQLELRPHEREETGEDGTPLEGSGYRLISLSSGLMVWNGDAQLQRAGLTLVNSVAGVSYRPDVLNSADFEPGRRIRLIADPANEHDRNAVGVWSADGSQQVGWLPRALAAEVSPRIRSGQPHEGGVIWQHRLSTGERCGINLLVGPPEPITHILGPIEE